MYRVVATGLLYTLASALILDLWWGEWGYENIVTYAEHFGVKGMLGQSAARPFVFRILTPMLVHAGTWVLHGFGIWSLNPRIHASLQERFPWWDSGPQVELYCLYVLHFASLIGTCVVWRALVSRFTELPKAFVSVAPCVGLMAYPLTFVGNGMIYDLPDLFLVSLCLLLWLERRFVLYYAAFMAAVACKEASLVLVAMALATFYRARDPRRAALHTALHGALFGLVHLPIRAHFKTGWERYLPLDHVAFLFQPHIYATQRLSYAAGLPLPSGLNVLVLLLFALSIGLYWRRKDPELRAIFVATFAVLVPMFIVGGYIDEVRVFAIAFPVAFVLGMQTFAWAWDEAEVASQDVAIPPHAALPQGSAAFIEGQGHGPLPAAAAKGARR